MYILYAANVYIIIQDAYGGHKKSHARRKRRTWRESHYSREMDDVTHESRVTMITNSE